ncbi:P-selectin glycoprotein ligand 1 [Apodemus speciosus]|uniref:P-selectin glycoprotein ligand 1 n=1 Tax=Apodemus speciosus TaxID=105296 RepID=A0ABQ0ESI5_APOSI
MFPRFLLLLTVLGPGNSLLPLRDPRGHETKEALSPVRLRERRQVPGDDDFEDPDYTYNTDPPELLKNASDILAAHPELLTTTATLEQRVSAGAGASETATSKVATTEPAGPGTGGPAVGMLSTESGTEKSLTTVAMTIQLAPAEAETPQPAPMKAQTSKPAPREAETSQPAPAEAETSKPAPREAETSQSAPMEAEISQPAPMEAETSKPAPREAETSQPAPMEAETSKPAPMKAQTSKPAPREAETSQPVPREAETSQPAPMEAQTSQPTPLGAETSQPAPTEAETSQPAPTEAETTRLPRNQAVESLFTTSAAAEAPSTEPTAMETVSAESNESTSFLGPSMTHKDFGHLPDSGQKKGLMVTPGSSLAPSPPGISDLIPVKQCLLVILVLASLATIFLVCTVVLAVRLSRKTHMYPVRNYSPTEMICISSLLPEGGEGAPVTANGGLPKVQDLKTDPSGDRDGDDLTLHSFLP